MGRRMKQLTERKKKQKEKKRERKSNRIIDVGESFGDKKWVNLYRFTIPAGMACPDSCDGAVGRVLGAHGVNVEEFCKKFNNRSRRVHGWVHTVKVVVFDDKTCKMCFRRRLPVGHPKRRLYRGPFGLID